MFKKVIALILAISVCLSIVTNAFANEITDFSEDALRISDEFEAQYPSGAFSLSSVAMETNEYSGRSVINVIRQGGTVGNISVKIKAIDISTKYGQDYSLSIPGFIFDKKIEGSETISSTISVIEQDEGATTTPSAILETGATENTPTEISEVGSTEETVIEAPKSTGLKFAREQAMGKTSDREKLAAPDVEEQEQIDTATAAAEVFYSEAPGTVFNLSYKEGERVKSFNLDIINDNIPEAQEQFIFVITEVSAGGVIGLQKETTVNIIDDEPYEMPVFGFASQTFMADGQSVKVTLTRTAGINYYAGGCISTFGDSAQAGIDYTEIGQKILFVPGQTELNLEIPIEKNENNVDKYFYVKLEPDKACTLLGDEVVQVLIPKAENSSKDIKLMSGFALQTVPEGVMLGRSQDIINYDTLQKSSGENAKFFIHDSGWYEVNINGKNAYGIARTEAQYHMSKLESIYANIELYNLGHSGSYNAAAIYGLIGSTTTTLAYGKNKNEMTYGTQHKLKKQIPTANASYKINPYIPQYIQLWVSTPLKSDKAAMRIYSIEANYRKFEFDVQPPNMEKVYTYDLGKATSTMEYVRPGKIEITTCEGQPMKGFYTSDYTTSFKVNVKDVVEGYHLKGVKFLNAYDSNAKAYTFDMTTTDTITIDTTWIVENANTYNVGGKFIVQPVFERNKASITVSIPEKDKNKGEIVGVINAANPTKSYTKVGTNDLFDGDKVILTGVGNTGNMVEGYNVSYNGNVPISESGSQNAGIHTITLKGNVSVSPIFGLQRLNVKRDPTNKKDLPNIQGTLVFGPHTTTEEGQLGNIKSGQIVDFISIPPSGYTTQWANRTGDTNGNGVLESEEIYDPQTGKLYRQYDYDVNGILDSEYDTPMFGDLFGYKINQPNPIFYYYYVPMEKQTIYNGKVSGSVVTREYTIRQKYTQTENAAGESVDKLVPVVGASVKMGGSYDRTNPDAQLGYGTTTTNLGRFDFNVTNVIKNAYYLLSVDYNGVSYVDKINPSSTKQLILPTFTSMKPISIDAVPEGGEDLNTVSGSIVMLKDKTVDFTLVTTSLENNINVEKAIFRIYSSNGTLLSEKTEDVIANKSVFSANLNGSFKANARFTVQLVDQNGNLSMEFNSGFEFRPPMQATSLLPAFAAPNQKPIPIVESVMGALDIGLARFTDMKATNDGYTLYVGMSKQFDEKSKVLKDTIDKAKEDGDSGTKAKEEIRNKNKGAPKKEDSNVKVKSTVKNNLGVRVSLEMNIKYDKNRDTSLGSPYYFGHLMLMVTLEDSLSFETRIVLPIGLSVVLKLGVGGSVTGYIYITPYIPFGEVEPIKVYADQYGNYPYYQADKNDPNRKFVIEGGVILEPTLSLSVGAEYGIADVTVEGDAFFRLIFSTSRSGSGTVTLKATVTVTTLGFEIYSKEFKNWSTSLFGTSSELMSQMLASETLNQSDFVPISREYLSNRSTWLGEEPLLQSGGPSVSDFTEKTLMQGIYPHPDPQLMRIDEDSLLMVFIDDHEARTAENRGAIYYCISHDNGRTYSQPVLLDNDGTLDSNPRLKDAGDRIICLYSSLEIQITDEMSMEDILEVNELEMAIFDKSTYRFSEPINVTKYTGRIDPVSGTLHGDYHSDVDGNAIYDETSGQVFIFYTKTDYTSDPDEHLVGTDLFDSYGAIAFMIYDTNTDGFVPYDKSDYPVGMTTEEEIQWNNDWYGQRFLNTEIIDASLPGGVLSDPLVLDLTAEVKDSTAYIAYTVDTDGDMETLEDRDIYLQTYDFANKIFSKPLKVSDMQEEIQPKVDGKPRLVLYNNSIYLFYNADTAIHYYELSTLFRELSTMDPAANIGEENYYSLAPGVALEYSEHNLTSDDYRVLVGDDGKLYLIWTEETMRLTEGVEPGSQAALKPENMYHENQVYASVFYEKIIDETATKNALEVMSDLEAQEALDIMYDYGKWSGKVQITAGPGSYSNPSVCIMSNGHIIIAAKKSEKILIDASETPRMDNPLTAELVALTLTPIAQAEMMESSISFGTEYPIPNRVTKIKATVGNHGLIPLIKPVVDFYMVQGGIETYIGTGNSIKPVYGGSQSEFDVNWMVPEDIQDIKIIAKLRTDDNETVVTQTEKVFPNGTKLEYGLFKVEYVAKNNYRAYLEVHHSGNQKLENAELVISRIVTDKNSHELKRVSIDNETSALEMFVINEGFEILQKDLLEGSADIEVRIESNDNLLVKQTAMVEKTLPSLYQELIGAVTGVELSTKEMTLNRGTRGTITAKASPVEADQMNNIVYVSSNPAVATVNGEGEITGLMSGSATITAYAVPKVDVTMHNIDGYVISGNILDTLALEDCKNASINVTVVSNSSDGTSKPLEDKVRTVDIYANSDKPVSITRNGYTVQFSSGAIVEILNGATSKTLDISITKLNVNKTAQMYSISVKEGNNAIKGLENSKVKISIPYLLEENENPNAIVAYRVTENGQLEAIPNCSYKNGILTFTTSDFTEFGIGHNLRSFTDVNENAWYADAVTFIASRGIAEGIGNNQFAPEKLMTREEFAKFIVSAFGFTWSGEKTGFNDVEEDSWYEQYVGALYEAGIISGTGNGNFGTEQYITRQDMAKILYAALQKSGVDLSKIRDYSGFNDDRNVSEYANEAVKALYEAGIISGVGNNNLSPTANAPRSNMAAMIKNMLEKMLM